MRRGQCVAQPSEVDVPNSGLAIAMGTAMDAVPEAIVLGLSLHAHGPNAALIAAITLGNLPEAMSASAYSGLLAATGFGALLFISAHAHQPEFENRAGYDTGRLLTLVWGHGPQIPNPPFGLRARGWSSTAPRRSGRAAKVTQSGRQSSSRRSACSLAET